MLRRLIVLSSSSQRHGSVHRPQGVCDVVFNGEVLPGNQWMSVWGRLALPMQHF
jgi:hypothetical protein